MKPATSQHTPTPWRVYDENPLEGEVYIKADGRDNGSLVAKVVNPGDEDGMDIARDTAAFIVQAVNCHKELLEALIAMQAQAGRTGTGAKAALDLAYKAIAKAEGSEVTK